LSCTALANPAASLPERSVDPEHRGWSAAEIPLSGAAGFFKKPRL